MDGISAKTVTSGTSEPSLGQGYQGRQEARVPPFQWAGFSPLNFADNARNEADGNEDPREQKAAPLADEHVAKVCDLDGFLASMEREDRPMEAVRDLRERLSSTNPETGAKWVPFLSQLKLEHIERKGDERMGVRYDGAGMHL